MPTYVFSVQDEIGERRVSLARLVILSLFFLSSTHLSRLTFRLCIGYSGILKKVK